MKAEKEEGNKEKKTEMMSSLKDDSVDNMVDKALIGNADEGRGTLQDAGYE